MTLLRAFALSIAMLLTGCANLSTISRNTDLPGVPAGVNSPAFAGGRAIHLDAQQRLFYQANGHFCAEPMPDALQSLASSSGVGASVGEKAAALSTAFGTSAASVGLHTQSTTLMRDQYYRICELAANTNMSAPQVAQLMERSQRFTLGILAVEQLTGAVAAQQAALSSDANSSAAANLGATMDTLNKARVNESNRKIAAQAAAEAASAADAASDKSKQAAAAAGATPADQAKAAADAKLATAADAQSVQAASDYKDAQDTVDALRKSLGTANLTATAAAKSSATLSPSVTTKGNIDKDTAQAIATATQNIVDSLLSRGDIVDSCMAMMMEEKAADFLTKHPDLQKSCQSAVDISVANAVARGTVGLH